MEHLIILFLHYLLYVYFALDFLLSDFAFRFSCIVQPVAINIFSLNVDDASCLMLKLWKPVRIEISGVGI